MVIDNLPGYPDNINRASDGNYWLALVGMRSPGARSRLADAGLPPPHGASASPVDEWLFPNINTGCVVKFNEQGEILETLWDLAGDNHPMITSMREHKGYLYLGGISTTASAATSSTAPIPTSCSTTSAGGNRHDPGASRIRAIASSAAARPRSRCRRSTAR